MGRNNKEKTKKATKYKKGGMSIRAQFSLIFIGVMAGVILLCLILNGFFLSKLYEHQKVNVIKEAYTTISAAAADGSYDSTECEDELNEVSRVNNISIVIVNADSELLFSSVNGERDMEFRLLGYILGIENDFDKNSIDVVEEADNYVIRRVFNIGSEYLEMVGRLSSGDSFLMRIPIDNIVEGANFANKIYLYIGLIGVLIGAVIMWLVTRRMTKPIEELNDISKRMVDLDFEARYTGNDRNEIGLLGDNINKLSDSLEKSISELKTANIELKKDIEKKNALDEMRQEFIANVSHELKTPIALIQGYAEGLRDGISDDEESRQYYCDVIVDEAGKMNNMVKKFLTLNQLEFGAGDFQMERFDISDMIDNYLASASMLADQDNIEVRKSYEHPVFVWADEFKAEEVFTNYFSNAVHYCLPDEKGERFIEIKLEKHDNVLRIMVFNTGNRIPEASIERVWEKFYKVDKARTREYGGSGVGLSIVKAIQDNLGMRYGVTNCDNGVTFWYELELK